MEAMRDIKWIDEGKTDEKGNVVEREGPDWFDRTERMIRSIRLRDEKNTELLNKIINNQSFDAGLRFKGGKEAGQSVKQTAAENKTTNETWGKILREIKNVKGQQDKMKEEICGRQNNLKSKLSRIREAIEAAAAQEEKSKRTGAGLSGDGPATASQPLPPPPSCPQRRLTHRTHIPTMFETRMEGVTRQDVEDEIEDDIDISILRCDDGGKLVYIDEIGTYHYACWEDMVEFYRTKNWSFPEKRV